MAPSGASDSPATPEKAERNLQPFFVLHKASHCNAERKSTGGVRTGSKTRTRRRIDLTPPRPKSSEGSEAEFDGGDNDDNHDHQLRTDAFNHAWSKIESTIKDVLRNINADAFNDVHCWVQSSFNEIRSNGMLDRAKATRPYPIVTNPISKQLYTGLVFTKNMELVDDLLTFEDLGLHLKSRGCHVANLSSFDFSAKNGIDGCLRGLLRLFVKTSLDVADMSVLALWYIDQGDYDNPVVVIIDDLERCCGSVLTDFILMLSEWVVKIPIILIFGVATSVDALRNILPSHALQCLSCHKFILGSPAERMDAIIEAVLVKRCSGFSVGHKVAVFLRNYFLRQDGTLTSFVRALKIAIVQHFSMEPLSFILWGLFHKDSQDLSSERPVSLPETVLKQLFSLPSCRRNELAEPNEEIFAQGLADLKRLQNFWSSVVLCLFEAGKSHEITLLDLYCETLDPELHHSRASDHHLGPEAAVVMSSSDHHVHGPLQNHVFISQVVRKVRDLPLVSLNQLLNRWEKHTKGIIEIHEKVRELQSIVKFEDGKALKRELTDISKSQKTRSNFNVYKDGKAVNEKAAALIDFMVEKYMQPIECIPYHEIICFKNVDKLQSALMGDPRRTIQVDLLEFHKFLKCSCCSKNGNIPFPSMLDTSIMYMLTQEYGDLINLHDWYQSFKATVLPPRIKGKHRLKHSPSPKKRKEAKESQNKGEATVQAKFCRAVTELQITGLLRMPSKRRPDYVQRVAFGL
ncbi:origin of replication complex subunit 3 isoform X2 [Rhododendron vialii]|uniref:origin of replication complex subunit 3 isoform X2 n=1 Tax=Rhododendron vialii TaxID=182163 RepID=UPI00265EDD8F|nr:origin of replication complex subunit 3 isoform X2 [Rhododendron vialii]